MPRLHTLMSRSYAPARSNVSLSGEGPLPEQNPGLDAGRHLRSPGISAAQCTHHGGSAAIQRVGQHVIRVLITACGIASQPSHDLAATFYRDRSITGRARSDQTAASLACGNIMPSSSG